MKDSFGHVLFSSSQMTVAQIVVNYLEQGRPGRQGRRPRQRAGHRPAARDGLRLDGRPGRSLPQRPDGGAAGGPRRERLHVDDPARCRAPIYSVRYDKVPLAEVANSERTFRKDWIAANGYDVTDDFVRYAQPLVGEDMITLPLVDGRQRLARLKPLYASQKLPAYVPQADRK